MKEGEIVSISINTWNISSLVAQETPKSAKTPYYYSTFEEKMQETILKIGHNLKYDLKVLSNYNLKVKGPIYDTLIAHYLINPDRRHGMDILASSYLNYEPQPITDLIGKKGKNQGNMRDVSLKDQTQYAVEDADITWQLKHYFDKELDAAENQALFNT